MRRTKGEREIIDEPGKADREEISRNLRDIARANRWLGGTRVVLSHLDRLIGRPPAGQLIRILDMATGSADIPVAIADWAKRRGLEVRITAVDRNPAVIEAARSHTSGYPEIAVDERDILSLPYPLASFDFVIASQVIHHLEDADVEQFLKQCDRLATQGIIISDLRRSGACIRIASVGSRLVRNRLSRHDSAVSFRNAFTPDEFCELAERCRFPRFGVFTHGICRMALVVDKRNTVTVAEPQIDQNGTGQRCFDSPQP